MCQFNTGWTAARTNGVCPWSGRMLRNPANEAFEISAFREVERRRMVLGLCEDPQHLSLTSRIKGSIGHNLLKEVRREQSRTRKGEESSPWLEKLEGKEIDVLVTPRSLEQVASGVHKFRGVQDDEVKAAVGV